MRNHLFQRAILVTEVVQLLRTFYVRRNCILVSSFPRKQAFTTTIRNCIVLGFPRVFARHFSVTHWERSCLFSVAAIGSRRVRLFLLRFAWFADSHKITFPLWRSRTTHRSNREFCLSVVTWGARRSTYRQIDMRAKNLIASTNLGAYKTRSTMLYNWPV